MFNLKETIQDIYNEGDKKRPLEQVRSESVEYIKNNIRSVEAKSLWRAYGETSKPQLISLPELLDSVKFNQVDKWNFDVFFDKREMDEKFTKLQNNNMVISFENMVYQEPLNKFSENDYTRFQVYLENDVKKFIETDFTEYLSKLVRRK